VAGSRSGSVFWIRIWLQVLNYRTLYVWKISMNKVQ
jgi:hypothetical protein